MKALQIESTGSLDAIRIAEVADPKPGAGEVCVRVEAAAINPSDVAIVMGKFPQLTLPRVMGRDFAGVVVEGPPDLTGVPVWGTGGGRLGLTHDGSHAEFLTVPTHLVARRPEHIGAVDAAAIGTPFLTAWSALVDLARVRSGEYVIVSGAAGAVGSAAVDIATTLGAHVIALVRSKDDVSALEKRNVAAIVRSDVDDLAAIAAKVTDGAGAAVALNAVGAPLFQMLVDALSKDGRMVVFSIAGGREVQFDLFQFYRKRLTFFGLDTGAFSPHAVRAFLERLTPLLESKAIAPQSVGATLPLAQAREAYANVSAGGSGKIVLTMT